MAIRPIFVVRDKFVIFEKWPFERNVVNGVGPLSVCENFISNPTVCFAQPKIKMNTFFSKVDANIGQLIAHIEL